MNSPSIETDTDTAPCGRYRIAEICRGRWLGPHRVPVLIALLDANNRLALLGFNRAANLRQLAPTTFELRRVVSVDQEHLKNTPHSFRRHIACTTRTTGSPTARTSPLWPTA